MALNLIQARANSREQASQVRVFLEVMDLINTLASEHPVTREGIEVALIAIDVLVHPTAHPNSHTKVCKLPNSNETIKTTVFIDLDSNQGQGGGPNYYAVNFFERKNGYIHINVDRSPHFNEHTFPPQSAPIRSIMDADIVRGPNGLVLTQAHGLEGRIPRVERGAVQRVSETGKGQVVLHNEDKGPLFERMFRAGPVEVSSLEGTRIELDRLAEISAILRLRIDRGEYSNVQRELALSAILIIGTIVGDDVEDLIVVDRHKGIIAGDVSSELVSIFRFDNGISIPQLAITEFIQENGGVGETVEISIVANGKRLTTKIKLGRNTNNLVRVVESLKQTGTLPIGI